MEEIYVNVEPQKHLAPRPSTDETGSRSSQRRFYGALLFLGLLSGFLLAFLISLGVHYRDSSHRLAAELSAVKANLTERFQVSDGQLSLMTAERDQLNASLIAMTGERNRLQSLSKQKKTCPTGWRKFSCSCYLLSSLSGSWERGREDCRVKGADLLVIESDEEQTFVLGLTQQPAWIGLNDKEVEGTWKWVDGTSLIKTYWKKDQPDNGGGSPLWGEEDCAHIRNEENNLWNDLSCTASLRWICEKLL
ncbi:C-type lectin domain family 10 member A MMGL Macrophage asialoglycoprotein-binding protein 1 [Channa argus]|uniref:C-type lectin domain family 10 member A MMGL Macrophage asialoglycoprotein-binding protein 1 n=1 Tax=Channa argus TaxID=215402 RepID=A0A6G1PWA1_CHAAH|nr:C-type lectin domain family 10 member A MMGL Macrophage asialoglycoprotein-binding protein 1 [Channa argus]